MSVRGNRNSLGKNQGEQNGNARLKPEHVRFARRLLQTARELGVRPPVLLLARLLGVGQEAIRNMEKGKTWKHL